MGLSETLHGSIDHALDAAPLRWLRRRRYERFFCSGKPFLAHRGVYLTRADAQRHLPAPAWRGYDSAAGARLHLDRVTLVYPSDYPVMLWLHRLFQDGCASVFDVGGNVGVSYYSFERFIAYPARLRWLVCEVPAVAAQGEHLAAGWDPRNQISFTEDLEQAEGFDVLLACGSLQYLPRLLSDELATLKPRPRHLILNSVALHPRRSFYTVQNIHGDVFVPYRITREHEFLAGYERLGYELRDRWKVVEKRCHIPFAPGCSIEHFQGFYFQLGAAPVS